MAPCLRIATWLTPLFPGYVFVGLDLGRHRWRSINGTLGVRHLFTGAGERPVPMPPGVVEKLIAMADRRGYLVSDQNERPEQGDAQQPQAIGLRSTSRRVSAR